MLERSLYKRLEELYPEIVKLRRSLHQNPELSFQEKQTPEFISNYLEKLGIEVKRNVGGRGVLGYIKGSQKGKTVALRADFDALPIQEETGVEYASKNHGVMHACGHDGHTATLLALAKALVEQKEKLPGNIVLVHQFAEECAPGGAISMIEDGCLKGVDVIYGVHLWATLPYGEIGYCHGPAMAAADKFEIIITGKGGHAASPHQTVDSVLVASNVVVLLQNLVSRNINPLESAVVTIGAFNAGSAFNIIADKATLIGTVRTFNPAVQDFIIEKMESIIKGVCDGAGATYIFKYERGYPALINHPLETERFANAAKGFMGNENVKTMAPVMGGEDFAYYLQKVPGAFVFIGAGNAAEGITYPHHHPKFNIDERSMLIAAKALASASCSYLEEAGQLTHNDRPA